MQAKFIGLHGRKGSGKSTVADYLFSRHNCSTVKMAGPLKDMIRVLLRSGGLEEQFIERCVEGTQEEKELPLDILSGKSTRHAMQTLGTEWRDFIDPNLWVNLAVSNILSRLRKGETVICDDIRFMHEIDVLTKFIPRKEMILVKIVRPSLPSLPSDSHASERPLDDGLFDRVLLNEGSLDDFRHLVGDYFERI